MRKIIFKKIISVTLSILILLSIVSVIPTLANASNNESFYSQSAQLIAENWSDDYFENMVLEIGEPTIMIDGIEKEIDSDGTVPIIIDNTIMLPVEAIINELGEEPFWDELFHDSIFVDDNNEQEHTDSEANIEDPECIDFISHETDEPVMLPLCVIVENLNLEADWDSNTGRITLTRDFQTMRIIVKTNNNVDLTNLGAETIISGRDGIHALQFDSVSDAQEAHDVLKGVSGVIYVEPDIYVSFINAESMNTDIEVNSEHKSWGVEKIGANKYAEYLLIENKTDVITVAVLDTGVDANHIFLNGRIRNDGFNTINGNLNTSDSNGHGTHVAGTIIDCTPNLSNIMILPVKVLSDSGRGTWLAVGNGISFAADKSVNIINMSLGGSRDADCAFIDDMVQYAIGKNVTVVVAAGNNNRDAINTCPAHIENVITVSAIDIKNIPAHFTNYGNIVDIAAPGVNINSSIPGNRFASYNGTSMAAPHVAAAVAMYILNDPSLTPTTVQSIVRQHINIPSGWQSRYGVGIINMEKALDEDTPPGPPLTLNPDFILVDDNAEIHTIIIGGIATGTITLEKGTLPDAVQLSVSDNSITVTGIRPAAGQDALTGSYMVIVNRESASAQLAINVNLTPQESNNKITTAAPTQRTINGTTANSI